LRYLLASEQPKFLEGKLQTANGLFLRISRCGIYHHPSQNPKDNYGTIYNFSARQDRLSAGLISVEVPGSRPNSFYVSVKRLQVIDCRSLRANIGTYMGDLAGEYL
jgi:hypothetical protein